jgi:hypothetical protein
VPIRTVAVQTLLAPPIHSVLIRDSLKLRRHPPPAHPLKSQWILQQPIDLPLKVLLGQVEAMCILGVHTLLQHLSVVVDDRLEVGVLETILDHFLSGIVEDQVGYVLVNTILQTKMFLYRSETTKFAQQKKK